MARARVATWTRAFSVTLAVAGMLVVTVAQTGCIELDAKIENAKTERARLDLKNFESALELYRTKKGAFPTQEEGLAAVQRSGILIELPDDPWKRPYLFEVVDGVPMVTTFGKDGKPGGKGADADLRTQLGPVRGSGGRAEAK